MSEPSHSPARPAWPSPWLRLAAIVLVVAIGGWLVGGVIGRQQRDGAQDEERELSRQNDRLGANTGITEDALAQLSERAKELKPSITGGSGFMATGESVKPVEFGDAVTDQGDTGTVTGVRVVDKFTSANEERLPGAAREGRRWLVIGGTYRTGTPSEITEACGGDEFATAVFTDGTTRGPYDEQSAEGLPRFPGQQKQSCAKPAEVRGVRQPFRVAIPVPEGSKVRGVLGGDMRIRTNIFAKRIPKTKLGWLEFDKPLDVGAKGDEVDSIGKEPSLS